MVHYLKEISISEAVIEDFTYFMLFWHCKRYFSDQSIPGVPIQVHMFEIKHLCSENRSISKVGVIC